jgi:hypothetical protein
MDIVKYPDRASVSTEYPHDMAAGPSKVALQWLNALNGGLEPLLEQSFKEIHADSDINPGAPRREV